MDTITIKDLVVFARHGVLPEEAVLGQKFLVTAVLHADLSRAGRTDDLEQTINYAEVSQAITGFLTENRYALIEAAAEQLAEHLLLRFPLIAQIDLEIQKPWAPVGLPLDTVSVRISRGWHTVLGALGSNMGDKEGYLRFAVERLSSCPQVEVVKVSDFIRTAPYGYLDQDEFLNGAVMLRTLLSPLELLDLFQQIEHEANRERIIHWGPRTLDLDILFYDDEVISCERLTVPHVEIPKRRFVLEPLAQIAPWWMHPLLHRNIQTLLEELDK